MVNPLLVFGGVGIACAIAILLQVYPHIFQKRQGNATKTPTFLHQPLLVDELEGIRGVVIGNEVLSENEAIFEVDVGSMGQPKIRKKTYYKNQLKTNPFQMCSDRQVWFVDRKEDDLMEQYNKAIKEAQEWKSKYAELQANIDKHLDRAKGMAVDLLESSKPKFKSTMIGGK